jgi:tetratricopeptide (TPR) repeat protein
MNLWSAILILFAACLTAAAAQPPKPAEPSAEKLVRDLGDDNYAVRERADAALRKLGDAAIPSLTKALDSRDAEVRLRAKAILADVELGITAEWPEKMKALARDFDKVTGLAEAPRAIGWMTATLGEKVTPFLLYRLGKSNNNQETEAVLEAFRALRSDAVVAAIVARVKQPETRGQYLALAWALAEQNRLVEALTLLAPLDPPDDAPTQLVEKALAQLRGLIQTRRLEEAAKTADQFCAIRKNDARFFYLRAQVLRSLQKNNEAEAAERYALSLHPMNESIHYNVAAFLAEIGLQELSIREYERVLAIPPESVLDMNACWRVGEWNQQAGNYDKAADLMEKGLEYYRRLRREHPDINLGNWTEEKMEAHAKYLREYARGEHRASGDLSVAVVIKDGKAEEMHKALRECAGGWTFQVLPHGIRLLDEKGATLEYDPQKRAIYLTLHGHRMQPAAPIELKQPKTRVGVNVLDCFYVFEVDSKTGEAVKLARYERDYVLAFKPSENLLALKDVTLKINDEAVDWQEFLKGKTFDYLPDKLRLHIEGVTPEGRRGVYYMTLEVDAAQLNGVVTGDTGK